MIGYAQALYVAVPARFRQLPDHTPTVAAVHGYTHLTAEPSWLWLASHKEVGSDNEAGHVCLRMHQAPANITGSTVCLFWMA